MSDEGKFRLSLAGNVAMVVSIIGSAFFLWTTIVQKYDEVTTELVAVNKQLQVLEVASARIDDLSKRIEAQGQHMLTDEQRETVLEGKVDALTSLLNQFMGSVTRPELRGYQPRERANGH